MRIETKLNDEVLSQLEEIHKMEVGSEKYKIGVDGVTKLMDKAIEIERLKIESEDKARALESEESLKVTQMEDEKKDRIVKNVIDVARIALPVGVTIWGTIKTIEFEKEGTITTIMGRGFIQKLLPKK